MTIAPESVTYIARRASPTARSRPDIAMPSVMGRLAGRVMARNFEATASGSPLAWTTWMSAQSRKTNITVVTRTETIAEIVSAEAASRRAARPVARPDRPRDRGRGGDGEPDVDRHGEERRQADIADRGLERLVAEPRNPEQRQEVDGEDRHEPDRPGRGHHRDVAEQRALVKTGRVLSRAMAGAFSGPVRAREGRDSYHNSSRFPVVAAKSTKRLFVHAPDGAVALRARDRTKPRQHRGLRRKRVIRDSRSRRNPIGICLTRGSIRSTFVLITCAGLSRTRETGRSSRSRK